MFTSYAFLHGHLAKLSKHLIPPKCFYCTKFRYRDLLYLHIKESSLSDYQVYTTGSLPGLPIGVWKHNLVSLFKSNSKTTPWISWSPQLWISTVFLMELTGAQTQGGEEMSTHTPPKHIWETDESPDNKDESSPLTHLTLPTCPFLSLMWVNEESLTLRARVKTK